MTSVEIDIGQRIDRFHRGQLKEAWLDIIEDESEDEKHSKIKELLDSYWKHILRTCTP